MSDLLTIGSSGVGAYQRALAIVSNNIANVSTDGYTRQDIALASNQPTRVGGGYIGTGVRFDAVRRQYDAFVESNLRNSNSDLESQKPLLSYVNRLIDVMGDASIGLTTAMNQFFESARDLSSDAASTISRSIFLRDADGLSARFRQLASQFDLLDNETRQSVQTDVGQINSFTQQLALMNQQLSKNGSLEKQPSELLDQRDLLLRNLGRAASLISSFKQVAVDQTSEKRRQFDLSELVDEVVLTVSPSTRRAHCDIQTDISDGLLLDSFPGPLIQVVTNLIDNAIKHGFQPGQSGQVNIVGRPAGTGWVSLTVRDDGRGIAPEHVKRVFDPFFTTRLGQGGSGLGLHIVHNIVTNVLGGQIEIQTSVGVGTSFVLTLPVTAPSATTKDVD